MRRRTPFFAAITALGALTLIALARADEIAEPFLPPGAHPGEIWPASPDSGSKTIHRRRRAGPPKLDASWAPLLDWDHISDAKYQTSLVGYEPKSTRTKQRELGPKRYPFAAYLNAMHNRIHVLFADQFLDGLDAYSTSDPRNNSKLVVKLEIVLDPHGRIEALGVVHPSGQRSFDLAALEAVTSAAPYGDTPEVIRSFDGNVYLDWEFHRDEVYACSTMNARPYLLGLDVEAGMPGGPNIHL